MGESALAFGPLAELELLNELLDSTSDSLTSLNEGLVVSAIFLIVPITTLSSEINV